MDYRNRSLLGEGQAGPVPSVVAGAGVGTVADGGGGVVAAVADVAACSRSAGWAGSQLRNVIEGSIRPEADQMKTRPAKVLGVQPWGRGGIQTWPE